MHVKIIVTTSTFPAHPKDHVPSFVLDQIRELVKLDELLEIHVLVPHNSYVDSMPDRVERQAHVEVRYHYFWPRRLEKLTGRGILPALRENPLRNLLVPFLLISQRRALTRLCRQVGPDLLYAHWFMPQGAIAYGVSRKLDIPFMFTTHASDVSILRRIPFAKRLIGRALRRASCYTAVSRRAARRLIDFFDAEEWQSEFASKLSIIPMGTDLSAASVEAGDAATLLGDVGVGKNRKFILALGRLSEKKGFNYLIDAYCDLPRKIRDEYRLVVAGDGQLMSDLRSQVATRNLADDVTFTGYVSGDLKSSLLQLATLFVLPSIIDSSGDSEGLPVTLMEALAAGKPIVATDVSGAEEVLTDRCGIIVPQKSASALKSAMLQLLQASAETRQSQAVEARRLAQQFAWDDVAARYLELIKASAKSHDTWRVLLINSDLAKNRGDRAITEGIIQLVREFLPHAEMTGLSEMAQRDREWFGIGFLNMDSNSINPLHWMALAREARRADRIYWGGGELLKDYTNKLALWYWCLKITWLHLFNSNIYGAFQGIGPTSSTSSKRLIAFAVNRTKHFAVRDRESFEKLVSWGVSASKLTASSDPAVLPLPEPLTEKDLVTLESLGVGRDFLEDFVAIAPRDWFHYAKSGLLPYRWRSKFSSQKGSAKNTLYKKRLVDLADLTASKAGNVLLLPMHMSEDVAFCEDIATSARHSEKMVVLRDDSISPALLRKLLAAARLMIGFRLHSNIIATSAFTPSINFYYVDKGRVYFDQIAQDQNAFPIEFVLSDDFKTVISEKIDELLEQQDEYRFALRAAIDALRTTVKSSFEQLDG